MFATNHGEADKSSVVVTGTLSILGHLTLVLFDYGSIHSFISTSFVNQAKLELESFDFFLSVTTSIEVNMVASSTQGVQVKAMPPVGVSSKG